MIKKKSITPKEKDEFMAASIGDLEWLKQSLRGQDNYCNFDSNGMSVVHLAATHGRFDCLKYLMEQLNVDVNSRSKHGWCSLHLCINNKLGKKALEIMFYLMNKGALLSAQNEEGITPVHQAASEGHLQCLKQLLEAGADFTLIDSRGNKPIDLAKLWGHRECAKLLATYGWHNDKKIEARQRYLIDKSQIEAILNSLEQKIGVDPDRKYRGTQSFVEWLHDTEEFKHQQEKQSRDLELQQKNQRDKKLQKYYADLNKRKTKEISNVEHPSDYSSTVHINPTFNPYPGNLQDVYPRDQFTLQPYSWSSPPHLNPLNKQNEIAQLSTANPTIVQHVAKHRNPSSTDTDSRPIENKLPPTSNLMHYKSNFVDDLPKKKAVPQAELYKIDDARFCFTNDISSPLFQMGLGNDQNTELFSPGSTSSSCSTSTNLSKYMAV